MTAQEFKLSGQSNSWSRIGQLAKNKGVIFSNLFQHFKVENLRQAYFAIDGSKATGIDRITKREYGRDLDNNLQGLEYRLHVGTYRPQVKRGVEIPKDNGKTRLIAVGSFEDKLVEWVLAKILNELYEPLFINTSYGFRPKRSAFQAVKTAFSALYQRQRDYVVDIDIKGFFDTVSHRKLIKMLQKRISDRKLLSLISRLLEVGIITKTELIEKDQGTPQGGIASPILSNVYLHYSLDVWFLENFTQKGGVITRYADDMVFSFTQELEANRFYQEVESRLAAYDLEINREKSQSINFTPKSGQVFSFLNFTFYWGTKYKGNRKALRIKTKRERLHRAVVDVNNWLRANRNRFATERIWSQIKSILRGHYNYFGLESNRPKLEHFHQEVERLLLKWLNRRSQRKSITIEKYKTMLERDPLPKPPDTRRLKSLITWRNLRGY